MASSRHRETLNTYMQSNILLRAKSYDLGTVCHIHVKPSWMMLDYVAFSTRVFMCSGWRRGYIREDQALPLRGSFPLVPRAASPPGRNLGACTERNSHKKSLRRSVSTYPTVGTVPRAHSQLIDNQTSFIFSVDFRTFFNR